MQVIKNNEEIYAIIYRKDDWKKGLNFITPDELWIQVGSWWYDKGRVLDSHIHKNYSREALKTQEMTYVVSGSMKVTLFNDDLEYFNEFILHEGDLCVVAFGGHGYEILDDDTKIIEAKNGPFVSVEKDKTKF